MSDAQSAAQELFRARCELKQLVDGLYDLSAILGVVLNVMHHGLEGAEEADPHRFGDVRRVIDVSTVKSTQLLEHAEQLQKYFQ